MPFYLLETVETKSYTLETCHNDVEFPFINDLGKNFLSLVTCSYQFDDISTRQPLLELIHPITKSNFRSYDNMRAIYLLVLLDERKNGDSLYSFSETHIVC